MAQARPAQAPAGRTCRPVRASAAPVRIEAVPEAVLKQLVEVPRCLRWDASARAVHVGGAPGEGAWRIERDALSPASPLPRVGGQESEVRLQLVAAWCALDTRAIHMERRWGDVTLPSGHLCAFRATEHVRIDPLAPDEEMMATPQRHRCCGGS